MLMVTHLAEVGEVGDDDAHAKEDEDGDGDEDNAKEDDDDDGDAKLKMLMVTHLAEVGRGVFGLRASSRTTCKSPSNIQTFKHSIT